MFDNLLNHIKNHKLGYSIGAVAIFLVVGLFGYGSYNGGSGVLGGQLRMASPFKKTAPKVPFCIAEDFTCTAFTPETCPLSGAQTRTCTLKKRVRCTNPDAVKPAERQSCQPEVPVPGIPDCTSSVWNCTEFEPAECPESGLRTRTCTMTDVVCNNPDAVKPLTREACEPAAPAPENTNLFIYSEGNPDSHILVAGSNEQLVSKYRVHPINEDFQISKLTIVNDTVGTNFGDDVAALSGVTSVTINYANANGTYVKKTEDMAAGMVSFDNLDFYAPAGEDVYLEVFANVSSMGMAGEAQSGRVFRLGLMNINNTAGTFEAVGQTSLSATHLTDANPTAQVAGSNNINPFVIRKSVPVFAKTSASETLGNGEKALINFSVTANNAGNISFGRLVFDIEKKDYAGGDLDLSDFKFYRNGALVTGVNIYSVIAGDIGVGANSLGGGNVNDLIIVSFTNEETVAAGSSLMYSLRATVVNSGDGDSIKTRISFGDEGASVTGKTANTNSNTARVYSTSVADSLMSSAATEFTQSTSTTARNIIWSDRSAMNHLYPTVAPDGTVTAGTGSYDWTNGYLLGISEIVPHTLTE